MTDAVLWLVAALALGVAELAVPGVFLIFLALAAAITGALSWSIPGLPLAAELGSFGVWTAVTVLIGRHWYGEPREHGADPLLNDRAARLIGATVTVAEPISAGRGRVAVGDSLWLARGPALAVGERARVVAIDGVVLLVEPADRPD